MDRRSDKQKQVGCFSCFLAKSSRKGSGFSALSLREYAKTLNPRALHCAREAKLSDSMNCWCAIVVAGEKWIANWGSKSKLSVDSLTCLLPNSPQKGLGLRVVSLSSPIP
jgi:hypothetical protein